MNEAIRSFSLLRMVEDALADLGDAAKIRRLIPVAWPILEIEHSLKVRLEESINLVERNVLEALARFGPVEEDDLCEWMGLQSPVLRHVLTVLDRFPGVLSRDFGLLTAAEGTLERCAQERRGREVVQKLAFLVNGPTGRLAPMGVNNVPPKYQLWIDLAGNTGKVMNRSGRELEQVCWIAASQSDAREELSAIVQGVDSRLRAEVGVPEGAFEVESIHGRRIGERWIMALGTLGEDGRFAVHPAGSLGLTLFSINKDHLAQFEPLLRRGDRTGLGLFDLREDKKADREIPSEWQDHAQCEAVGPQLTIRLKNPAAFNHWQVGMDDDGGDDRPVSAVAAAALPRPLWITIGRPYIWHPYYFTVRTVVPGDKGTAEVMLKQRALMELERLADSGETSIDLVVWWKSQQDKVSSSWPEAVRPSEIPLRDLLKIARRSTNPDLVELVLENS